MKLKNEIEDEAKKLGLEIESYKVNDKRYNIESVEALHTDSCNFIGNGVCTDDDDKIKDWAVVTADDYNSTIYANCGNIQEEDVMVVVIAQ